MVTGRAETDEQKKQAMDRLLDAWKRCPSLRLTQFLFCAVAPGADMSASLYNLEDFDLVRDAEEWARLHGGEHDE
jgi:hypothetical protein